MMENFLIELKEEGLLDIIWIQGCNNPADLFIKNLDGPLFRKYSKVSCGEDEY